MNRVGRRARLRRLGGLVRCGVPQRPGCPGQAHAQGQHHERHRDAPEHLQALGRVAATPVLQVHPTQVRRGPGHNAPQQRVAQREGQGRQARRVAAAGDGVEHGEGDRREHEELEQEYRGDGGRVPQDEDGHRDPQVRGVDVAGGECTDRGLGGGASQHEAVQAPGGDDGGELGGHGHGGGPGDDGRQIRSAQGGDEQRRSGGEEADAGEDPVCVSGHGPGAHQQPADGDDGTEDGQPRHDIGHHRPLSSTGRVAGPVSRS